MSARTPVSIRFNAADPADVARAFSELSEILNERLVTLEGHIIKIERSIETIPLLLALLARAQDAMSASGIPFSTISLLHSAAEQIAQVVPHVPLIQAIADVAADKQPTTLRLATVDGMPTSGMEDGS